MMQTHLYLYLHDNQRLEWLLVNHGERLAPDSGSWSDLETHLADEGVVQPLTTVILSGYQTSYLKTELSAEQQKYAANAVAYAIEEKLSLDPSDCHVVLEGKPTATSIAAWVVSKTLMESINSLAATLKLRIRHCYVDTDIALCDSDTQFVVTPSKGLLCRAQGTRLCGPIDWLGALCEGMEKSSPIKALYPQDIDGKAVFDAQLANHFDVAEQSVTYGQPLVELLVDGLMTQPNQVTNLWVGDFSTNPQKSRVRRALTQLSLALVLIVFAFMAKQYGALYQYNQKNDALSTAIDALCHDIFGAEKVCQETFLQKEISLILRRDELLDTQGTALLPTLTDIANSMGGKLQLTAFRFDQKRAEVVFSLKASNFLQLESVKDQLTEIGHRVNMSASQKDDYIEGNVKLAIAGAGQ